jgi:prophage tail gpP-like protein
VSTHISADRYEITITARGKTRRIVDSSHVFKGGTTLGAITRPVVEQITRPFGVVLDWRAPVHDMDRSVLRDGGNAKDEVHRVCNEYGYYCWETRDGKLRVADQAGPETGEPIILGDNVLVFGTSQGDDNLNSDISVQGQRTKKGIRGKAAVNRSKRIKMPFVEDFAPLRLQHYTDATDEALQRRAEFEANNRLSDSFTVQVEVFHVQARDGSPWDIGTLHYVEIPCEGIFDVMECTALEYEVDAERNLKTRLTLSPPPGGAGGGAGGAVTAAAGLASIGGLASLAGAVGTQAAAIASIDISAARMALHGFKRVAGQYPLAWGVPTLVDAVDGADDAIGAASGLLTLAAGAFDEVPLLLPPSFKGT